MRDIPREVVGWQYSLVHVESGNRVMPWKNCSQYEYDSCFKAQSGTYRYEVRELIVKPK